MNPDGPAPATLAERVEFLELQVAEMGAEMRAVLACAEAWDAADREGCAAALAELNALLAGWDEGAR